MAINRVALLRLADKLEGKGPYRKAGPIPPARFNMSLWVQFPDHKYNEKLGKHVAKTNLTCGTAACAAGWAGSDPWFRKRGFYTLGYNEVYYKGEYSFQAVQKLFKLSNLEVYGIFANPGTPREVARRIRDFVVRSNARRELEEASDDE